MVISEVVTEATQLSRLFDWRTANRPNTAFTLSTSVTILGHADERIQSRTSRDGVRRDDEYHRA
jgi:hypothetical protein